MNEAAPSAPDGPRSRAARRLRLVVANAPPVESAVITDAAQFDRLRPEWDDLHAAVPDAYFSDGFGWSRLTLEHMAAQVRPYCAVVRKRGETQAIWPLCVVRRAGWRVGAPLTANTSEYPAFLIRPGADLEAVWDSMLREFRRRGDIDALWIPNVRDDGPLDRCFRSLSGAAPADSVPAPYLRRGDFADWEAYQNHLPASLRAKLRRDRRRLAQLGEVRFEELTDPAERQTVWAWMIENKRAWLRRHKLRNDWMFFDSYPRFVAATLERFGPGGGRRILALRLNDRVIAAELVNVDRQRLESFLGTFDEDYARCGPGNILREEQVRWAFERGLDYDCRMGGESYKDLWTNRVAYLGSYGLALNARGGLYVSLMRARRWAAKRTPAAARNRIAALLRRSPA